MDGYKLNASINSGIMSHNKIRLTLAVGPKKLHETLYIAIIDSSCQ